MKITQRLQNPGNWVTGGTAVATIPIGLSIEELYLAFTGSIAVANMTNIVIKANGKPIQEFRTGTELNLYNVFNKRTTFATNSVLVLDLTRRLLIDRAYRELTKLGTGYPVDLRPALGTTPQGQTIPNPNYNPFPVQSLTLEFDNTAVDAAATLRLYAKVSEAAPTGLIRKIRKFGHNPGASPFQIPDYPRGDLINAIYINYSGTISDVKLLRDNYTIFDRTRVLNNLIQTDNLIRVPQAGLVVLDTTEEGYGDQLITTSGVNDFRLEVTYETTVLGSLTTTVDYVGQLDR